ncbi:MAG TPA: DUF6599 family protein [Acidobacteriaceae bacterium]|nr:DUF6599 family protein [Acidobacteriaceae bacterium]
MRRTSLLLILALSAALPAQQPTTTLQLPPRPLLPMSFAGWTAKEAPVENAHPANKNDALMQELGFKREAMAIYQNGPATLEVDAVQFADATSAYAFFTDNANGAIENGTVNLRRGDTVVMAHFDGAAHPHLREDLQTLAKTLPVPFGSRGELPELPTYLPKSGLNTLSVQYALGPVGFSNTESPLAGKLDFSTDAEVVVGNYGSGTLTLIEYPTPQMAIAQLQSIATMLQLTAQKDLPDGLLGGNNEVAWRSGPLVALTSSMPQAQAVKLAHDVHYELAVTWDKPEGYVSDAWRAAHLYLGIFALAGILCGASIILGLFFGGARAISRLLRGKSASSVQDIEFISLDLGHGGDYKSERKD